MNTRDTILNLLVNVHRPGMEKLTDFLNNSDFFTAPCSTRFHLACPGGLAQHSLNVFNVLWNKINIYQELTHLYSMETAIVCGIFHDLCKINLYVEDKMECSPAQLKFLNTLANRNGYESYPVGTLSKHASTLIDWLKDHPENPEPELSTVYKTNDQFPLGHGEKSVSVLQDFISLTPEEKLAIRWHMGPYILSTQFDPDKQTYNKAQDTSPLVTLLFLADLEASRIVEREAWPETKQPATTQEEPPVEVAKLVFKKKKKKKILTKKEKTS